MRYCIDGLQQLPLFEWCPNVRYVRYSLLCQAFVFMLSLIGIVTLLFSGITLKHYAYDNMSLRTKRATKYVFQVLSQLSENFIFIYLGVNLFTQTGLDYKPIFILVTTVSLNGGLWNHTICVQILKRVCLL